MNKRIPTHQDLGLLLLRLTIGGVFLPHGAQKLLGRFDGPGFSNAMGFLSGMVGTPLAFLVIMTESIGALSIILGLGTRFRATAMIILNIGIIATAHRQNGFFMNRSGKAAGEGIEFFLLIIGGALAILAMGAGKRSLDKLLCNHKPIK